MTNARSRSGACLLAVVLMIVPVLGAQGAGRTPHSWKPVADDVYLQEVGEKLPTDKPVTSLAVLGGSLYAVMDGAVHVLRDGALTVAQGAPAGVTRMRVLDGSLWVAAGDGAYRLSTGTWLKVDDKRFVDFCLHLGEVHGATRDDVYRFDGKAFVNIKPETGYLSSDSTVVMEDFSQVLADPVRIGPIDRISSYDGSLYILNPGRLSLLEGARFVPEPIDWGTLPSPTTRDMLVQGSRLYITTDRGVAVLRGMAMTTIKGAQGLPYEDTTCLADGFDGDLWIGTTTGAIRKVGSDYHYFGADHWLPGDDVHDIAVGDHVVYIATDQGLGVIRYEPYTLLKKADYFEKQLELAGHKRMGFVHLLYWDQNENAWLREISDNDGGHTAHYLAAMSFKYAATGDEKARAEAVDAFKAMAWLDDITPKDGFIARAIWSVKGDKGRRSERGSGGLPAKWYPTDDGLWQWKGDTSSDEVNGHIFAVSIFHDLAAKGAEKERAAKHIANIANHIIDNGWVLRDMDGKPTRWGRWDPKYLLTPYGMDARGLNGMEAQAYMHTAFALTGDDKFKKGLDQLLEWRYHTYTVRQRQIFPPDQVVPWDDELAFRCYYPLLTYTQDPYLRSIYLRSISRSYEVKRIEHVPYFNFIYGAMTGNDCEAPEAVQHLREWSLDLRSHSYRNSHRDDLDTRGDYVPYSGGTRAISPRESAAKWGTRPALGYDGNGGGRIVTPPIGWLEDYWMGRYHGIIEAPKTDDPALTTVALEAVRTERAEPYSGPPRPE